jgi:hypothetical protein
VIDGDGWRPGAIPWLKEAVAQRKYTGDANRSKKIEVVDMKGFVTWANSLFV